MGKEAKQSDEDSVIAASIKDREESSSMHIKIHAPYKVYFDGEANSITAENDTGEFDVLGKHHNFITLLNTCEIVVRTNQGEEKVNVQQGIMHVKGNEVIVFLDV